jgi:HD-GYP domain-containing protein (c-di-GMP phosphodiesterase class II)
MPYISHPDHPNDEWLGSSSWKQIIRAQNILIPLEDDRKTISGFVVLDDSYFPEESQSTLFDYAGSNYRESSANLTFHRELQDPTLEDGYVITLLKLAYSIDHCNELTQDHAVKTAYWSRKIAEKLGFSQEQLSQIELASMLHDIGKVVVPKSVLTKPSQLSAEEWMIMRRHPTYGALIMRPSVRLLPLIPVVKAHHEYFDGTGYPMGLSGSEIPIQARIIAAADAYTTMTEGRIYQPASSRLEALDEFKRCSGIKFDPEVARLMIEMINSGDLDDSQCHWEPI